MGRRTDDSPTPSRDERADPSAAGIGILALQGDFAAHAAALQRLGAASVEVRRPHELAAVSALVMPGGESTTLVRLLRLEDMWEPLRARIAGGMPVLATCAGLILLANEVVQPQQPSLGLLDVTVARNDYGRQIHSGTVPLAVDAQRVPAALLAPDGAASGVFIRAPRILRTGPAVEVLAWRGHDAVLVRQGAILGTCFHPELQPEHFVTRLFLDLVRRSAPGPAAAGPAAPEPRTAASPSPDMAARI